MQKTSRLVLGIAALALVLAPAAGWAEEEYILNKDNWQKAEGLLPDPVLKRVKAGDYQFKVVPLDAQKFRENYSSAYWAASEANEGKYELDEETCGLKDKATGQMPDWVFGKPFPKIDPKDPQAACKVAWNFYLANQMGEGAGATFTLNGIDRNGEFRRIKLWLHANSYLGRHKKAESNPENLRGTTLSHALEPADAEGVNILGQQVNDWTSQDNIWAYIPQTRRSRRVNAASRSDPISGLDIFSDDLNCYAGKVEYYKWKMAGEGEVLAPIVGPYALKQNPTDSPTRFDVPIPYLRGAYETPGAEGAPWQITENLVFVKRPVWILEGESTDPYYNFGKVIMYVDKEMSRIYWKNVHNRAGEYFYTAMCGYHFSKSDDGTYSATTPNMVMGVNDKTDRAALGGRYSSQFLERNFDPQYFSLRSLSRLSD
ncbi:MAG TPA: DUF1329 domain-containing protein [Candidatus Binatia bacterium]